MARCLQAAALLLCAAAAHGQDRGGGWAVQSDEVTRGTVIVDKQTVLDGTRVTTDLKFARSITDWPFMTTVSVATDRLTVGQVLTCSRYRGYYQIVPPVVDVRRDNHGDTEDSALDDGSGNSPPGMGTLRFHIKASAGISVGDLAFTLSLKPVAQYPDSECDNLPAALSLAFTVTVAASWRPLAADRAEAAKVFSYPRINATTAAVPTGIAIQRDSEECGYTSLSLVNSPPAAFHLRKYSSAGTADGQPGTSFTGVAMGREIDDENDDDRHVKLEFKSDAATQAGTYTISVGIATYDANCPGRDDYKPLDQTVAYEVTMSSRDSWEIHPSLDRITQTASMSPVIHLRQMRAVQTGFRFHRNSQDCEMTDVSLETGAPAYVKLGLYNAAGTQQGSLASSFDAVPMKRAAADAADRHVRLLIDATAMTIETTAVGVAIEPNSSCTSSALPLGQTLSLTISVATPAGWRTGFRHDFSPLRVFNESDLLNNTRSFNDPEPTGMGFQASPDINPSNGDCALIDVELDNAPPFVQFIQRDSQGRVIALRTHGPRDFYTNHPIRRWTDSDGNDRFQRPLDLVFPRGSGPTGGVHTITVVANQRPHTPAAATCKRPGR